jgi:hypothetical protein
MECEALEFQFDATLEQLCDRLNELGPWTWMLRDSHWYGDYLYTAPAKSIRVRVLEPMEGHGPPYTIQVNRKEELGPSLASVLEVVAGLLGKLGVEDAKPVEPVWD